MSDLIIWASTCLTITVAVLLIGAISKTGDTK